MTNIETLDFSNNQLIGSIPSSFVKLTELKTLRLNNNQLGGNLPDWIGQLNNLEQIYLSNNKFTGNIPNTFNQLSRLTVLSLYNNQLTGLIPSWIGKLSNLDRIFLDSNQFNGLIPTSLLQLTNLKYLAIFKNNCLTTDNLALVAFLDQFDKSWQFMQGANCPFPANNAPKNATVSDFKVKPEYATTPVTVALDASGVTSSNTQIVNYAWKSSDGQTTSGKTASFTFQQAGVYDITLTITDSQGATTSQTKRITAAPIPKLASASYNNVNNTPDQALPVLVNDTPIKQIFFTANDVDWYEFYGKSGSAYTIEIPGNSIGSAINPSLELFDNKNTALTSDIKQSAQGKGIKISVTAPYTGLFRIKVTNNPPFVKIADPSAYEYQLRVYLTDAPLQGLVKGYVNNACTKAGLHNAVVAALLGNNISDSTFTHKTGEYGLLLNPNSYTLKSSADSFQDTQQPVTVSQIIENVISFNQSPKADCAQSGAQDDSVLQKQRAVAVYYEQSGMLIIRDVWAGNVVYYAELQNVGDFRFQLGRAIAIPGTIHALPGDYGFTPMTANLPAVFAYGKTWKVQMKNQGDWLFTIEKVE